MTNIGCQFLINSLHLIVDSEWKEELGIKISDAGKDDSNLKNEYFYSVANLPKK
jgi:hypothetical protein